MASAAAAATSSSASLRLLAKPPKPLLSKPHLLTLCAPVSFQRLVARSSASPTPSAAASASTSASGVDPARLPPALRDIVALFQSVPDPRTRYKQLLAYAARLPPMDPALKTDANRVRGCVSQVWVHAAPEEGAPDRVSFQADSDAQLTKGLAALLVLGLSGAPARDVAMVPIEFIELLGIRQSLSPSRNSGLLNMLSLMKRKALEVATGEASTEEFGNQEVAQEVAKPPAEKEPEFAAFGVREEEASEVHSHEDEEQLEEVPAEAMEGNGGLGGGRQERIRESLERGLSPVQLEIEDISHLHKGHAGVSGSNGETHFNVRVVSDLFQGKSLLKRHRAVYDLLQDELKSGLHALSIDAKTPSEV
ncbi:sufE-like protein 1, chloroplastic/mitochondrial [Oryza brachyantha]|uniref:sufE-like protein 1, chloroplastic/mitochondrial n=1 Tax=Oryza brachyantha TaxID=4533 RepID=UPI001ADB2EB5|nr:sufE-like protein 1, chloroplastic/mitochondrial [Oryza brachyantha]XP_040383726.1 sufE-like protein 1, chloroplastic/mitochondrial [Oryza brachyantha]